MRFNFHGTTPPPPAPTRALPGSPEKVAVLRERARLGQALWHPLDATQPISADADDWEEELLGVA